MENYFHMEMDRRAINQISALGLAHCGGKVFHWRGNLFAHHFLVHAANCLMEFRIEVKQGVSTAGRAILFLGVPLDIQNPLERIIFESILAFWHVAVSC